MYLWFIEVFPALSLRWFCFAQSFCIVLPTGDFALIFLSAATAEMFPNSIVSV